MNRNGIVQLNLQSKSTSTDEFQRQIQLHFAGETTSQALQSAATPQSQLSTPESAQSPDTTQATAFTPRTAADSTSAVELNHSTIKQEAQRSEYVRMQREREQKARDERERIKQQIKSDREERRRQDELRKQNVNAAATEIQVNNEVKRIARRDVRVQARLFDGSNERRSFPTSATISADVRPWLDELAQGTPYNLKVILTPLPTRNIEAAEEEQSLADLGLQGSCTLIMVPVKGYVDSYATSAPGVVGSAVSGGYNLVTGTAGAIFGGVRSFLGYGEPPSGGPMADNTEALTLTSASKVRVRTLADQRAEQSKRNQQFYNGNQLNFQPRAEDEKEGD